MKLREKVIQVSKKKVLIITHKPEKNYGGIAQAYALQEFLKSLGFAPETTASMGSPYFRHIISNPLIRKILRKGPLPNFSNVSINTRRFVNERIVEIPFASAKQRVANGEYLAYVTGSDQVWRSKYSYIPDNLFSFVKDTSKPMISYAASFGKDDIEEYSSSLKKKSKKLAQRFKSISVREESGVKIVQQYWGQSAHHHVDPTLLLSADHYSSLIKNSTIPLNNSTSPQIFTYILDPTIESKLVVQQAEETLAMKSHELISADINGGKILPPFEEWLLSFQEANFVITDSFHGTVFAIIFNKPFLTIGNHKRGLARFTSLLRNFSLEDRLITETSEVPELILRKKIDWDRVNSKIGEERERSRSFLQENLKD